MKKTTALGVVGALTLCSAAGQAANEQPTAEQNIEALKEQKERLQLELDLDKIKLEKLKLITDALPSFEGKAEADKNTGEFEAAIIANASLAHVAGQFAERFEYPEGDKTKTLILAGDEQFSFGLPNALAAEMRSLRKELLKVCGLEDCNYEKVEAIALAGVGSVITVVTAVAGLLRSDVSLTTLSVSDTTDTKFARLLASEMDGKARTLSGNPGIRVSNEGLEDYNDEDHWKSDDNLSKKFVWLLQARPKLNKKLADLKKKPKENDKAIKAMQAWLKSFAAFEVRVTKVDGANGSPLGRAIDQEKLSEEIGAVVRVYASAGGRLKKSAHLSTALFGADPFRVSAGLRAYAIRYGTSNEDSRPEIDGYLEYACTSKNLHFHQLQDLEVTTDGETQSDAIKCWELGSSGKWKLEIRDRPELEQLKITVTQAEARLEQLKAETTKIEERVRRLQP